MSDPNSSFDPVAALAGEFAERYRRGERPSLTEYTDRYPKLAEQIRERREAAACALRSAPPNAIRLARLCAPVPSTAASAGACGAAILAASYREASPSGAGWLGLAG